MSNETVISCGLFEATSSQYSRGYSLTYDGTYIGTYVDGKICFYEADDVEVPARDLVMLINELI